MKINFKTLIVFLASAFVWVSCEKPYDYDKEITPKYSPEKMASAINGKWELTKALHIDEKSITKESIDITDFYAQDGASLPNITFATNPQIFTVDTAGVVFNYFNGTSGTWAFDDDRYPSQISLTDNSGSTLGVIKIGSNLLGLTPTLTYVSEASCGGEKAMTYNIQFTKK
jgi:hypothetical protein